jgi:hypothetical protein
MLEISNEGDLSGKVTVTYTGLNAWNIRVAGRNQDDAARRKLLEDGVKECIPAGSELELTNTPDWQSANSAFVAEYQLKVPGWISNAGRRALLPTGLFSGSEKHLFEHANRVWPVYFRNPFRTVDNISITLPHGWKVETLPKDVDRDAKAVEYTLKLDDKDGALHIQRTLRSDLVMVAKENYSILRTFYQLVKTEDEQQVILQLAAASAAK